MDESNDITKNQNAAWLEVFISTVIYWLSLKLLFVFIGFTNLGVRLYFLPFLLAPGIVAFVFTWKNKRSCSTAEAFLIMLFGLMPVVLILSPVMLNNANKPGLNLFFTGLALLTYLLSTLFLKGFTLRFLKTTH
ncbi:MAG TPA: hypothetical protein ENI97_02880 [Gammaproteobacteria bacterium]|nr:hypothetical protein [Gammaproteobacteria bacterium]